MSESLPLWPWTAKDRREQDLRERLVQRRMGICVHNIRGTMAYPEQPHLNLCGAGIDIQSRRLDHPVLTQPTGTRCGHSFPCNAMLNGGGATCPQRVLPTREEAIARVSREEEQRDDD